MITPSFAVIEEIVEWKLRHSNHFNTCKYSGGERLSKMSQDKPWGLCLSQLDPTNDKREAFRGTIELTRCFWVYTATKRVLVLRTRRNENPVNLYTNCRGEHEACLQIIFHTDLMQLAWIHSFSLGCKPARSLARPPAHHHPKP